MLTGETASLIALWTIAAVFWTWVTLLAVWTALGRGPAWLRLLIGAAPAGALWWIGAKELIPVFLTQWLVVAGSLFIWNPGNRTTAEEGSASQPSPGTRPTFSLLGFLVFLAAIGFFWRAYINWPEQKLVAVSAAISGVASISLLFGRGWLIVRWMVAFLTLFAAWILLCFYFAEDPTMVTSRSELRNPPKVFALAPALSTLFSFLVLQALTRSRFIAAPPSKYAQSIGGRIAIATGVLMLLPLAVIACGVLLILLFPRPIPEPSLPDTGAYRTLLRVNQSVSHEQEMARTATSTADAQSHVEQIQALLHEAGEVLSQPSGVVVDYADLPSEAHGMRPLMRAYTDHALAAMADGRSAEAGESYLDVLRLAQAVRRDGVVAHHLSGAFIEGVGVSGLTSLHPALSAEEQSHVLASLLELERSYPPTDRLVAFEHAWLDRLGWRGPLDRRLVEWFGQKSRFTEANTQQLTERNRDQLLSLIEQYKNSKGRKHNVGAITTPITSP